VKSGDLDAPIASVFNSTKKYVASRTLEELYWNNSMIVKSGIVEEIEQLKQHSGP